MGAEGLAFISALYPISIRQWRAGVWRRGNIWVPPWAARAGFWAAFPPAARSVWGGPSHLFKKHPIHSFKQSQDMYLLSACCMLASLGLWGAIEQ